MLAQTKLNPVEGRKRELRKTFLHSGTSEALSLHQLVVLRAEVEGLKSEVWRRKEEGQGVRHRGQGENISSRRSSQEYLQQSESRPGFTAIRRRRMVPGPETLVSQPCLQLLPNHNRKMFTKEISSAIYTGLPWQAGLRRGSALEAENDRMLVREEGYYFVYSQVYYRDATFAMGHVVTRWKSHVVGGEHSFVFLFRCIQTMDPDNPYNTCYTGGIVKLDVGDYVELLIPRPSANLSLDGDSTFLGAIKLG
uniref:TNF superfamily member 13b n=1 Tax=Salarias fasciatus TaxID=181472 RepID=A0A672GUX3_SALFA